ncbi:hypothetical protein JCM3774_005293 [Rhodotorula dairenensis]
MKLWAQQPKADGLILCGNQGLNDVLLMVTALNKSVPGAHMPMSIVPVLMPDRSTFHSKALTGYNTSTNSVMVLLSSANLLKLGMGTTGVNETPHVESGSMDVLPADSTVATAWVQLQDKINAAFYSEGHLLKAQAFEAAAPRDATVERLKRDLAAVKKNAMQVRQWWMHCGSWSI